MDRCLGAHQQCRIETPGSHSSRVQQLRQELTATCRNGIFPSNCVAAFPTCLSICDPSHIGGKRELIAPLCQQAMDLGFDGLIVESHCNPDCAWSDAAQQVTPDVLDYILNLLVIRTETPNLPRT